MLTDTGSFSCVRKRGYGKKRERKMKKDKMRKKRRRAKRKGKSTN